MLHSEFEAGLSDRCLRTKMNLSKAPPGFTDNYTCYFYFKFLIDAHKIPVPMECSSQVGCLQCVLNGKDLNSSTTREQNSPGAGFTLIILQPSSPFTRCSLTLSTQEVEPSRPLGI